MRLLAASRREPLDRPPIWFMRQAGRYLPEYRALRVKHSFAEAMSEPELAAEITLQPLRRFPLDAAIVFADIMTPLGAMGVDIEFAPGPKMAPLRLADVTALHDLDPMGVDAVSRTITRVRSALDPSVAVIGFAGGPATLLAYLLEGGGSQQFPEFRRALHGTDPSSALEHLGRNMRRYLEIQIEAGADSVQLFDTWAGLLSTEQYTRWALPAVRAVLGGLTVPTIYFAPGAAHLLDVITGVGATGYGVDWRLPLGEAWRRLGEDRVIQGNLDPAMLLSNPSTVVAGTRAVLDEAAGGPGHVFNLGHGILPDTPIENVEAMIETVVGAAGEEPIARRAEEVAAR